MTQKLSYTHEELLAEQTYTTRIRRKNTAILSLKIVFPTTLRKTTGDS